MERPRIIITLHDNGTIRFVNASGQADVVVLKPYDGREYPSAYCLEANEDVRQVQGATAVVTTYPPFGQLPDYLFDEVWRQATEEKQQANQPWWIRYNLHILEVERADLIVLEGKVVKSKYTNPKGSFAVIDGRIVPLPKDPKELLGGQSVGAWLLQREE